MDNVKKNYYVCGAGLFSGSNFDRLKPKIPIHCNADFLGQKLNNK